MSIEAMKQALEALDEAANVLTSPMFADAAAALREAIEQAEKPVAWQQELGNILCLIHRDGGHYISEHGWRKAIDDATLKVAKLNSYMSVPQYEHPDPVAWRLRLKGAQQWVIWDTNPIEMMDGGKFDVEPLYAEPYSSQIQRDWSLLEATQESLREHMAEIKRLRQRQWVGLTDENRDQILIDAPASGEYYWNDIVRISHAIETKLKEKNEAP
jgi:hypothetical protein